MAEPQMKVQDALAAVEARLAQGRLYQEAHIVKGASALITDLQKQLTDLKSAKDDEEVSEAAE